MVDKQVFPYGSKTPSNLYCKFSTCNSCNDLCTDCDFYVLDGEAFSDFFSSLEQLKDYKMNLDIVAEVSSVAQRPY